MRGHDPLFIPDMNEKWQNLSFCTGTEIFTSYGSVTTRAPEGKQFELEMKFDTNVREMALLFLTPISVTFWGMKYKSEREGGVKQLGPIRELNPGSLTRPKQVSYY